MGKKILIGITILLISGLLAGWYFFTREAKYFGTSALKAVPESGSVIFRIHHVGNFAAKSLNNQIWKTFSGFPGISSFYQQINFADSLLKNYAKANNTFTDKDLTVVLGGKNEQVWNLCLIELSSLAEKGALTDFSEKYFSLKNASKKNVRVGGADLTCYNWKNGDQLQNYCTSVYHGLFLASADQEIVVQAIKQLQSPPQNGNSVFELANKTATDNVDLNIYINHRKLSSFSRRLFSESFWKRLQDSTPLAEWSEIDLTQKEEELLFNGFSFVGDSLKDYLTIFLHQEPDSFRLAEVFPAKTSFFISYLISNNKQFFRDYESHLGIQQEYKEYKSLLDETNSLYKVNLQKIVAENLDGAVAMVFTRHDPAMPHENKFLLLRVGSGSRMEKAMIPLTKLAGNNRKSDLSQNSGLFKIDKENVFRIYKTPVFDFGRRVFGEVFSDVRTNYFAIYDNYLIMGPSFESLGQFIRSNILKETLGNDPSYREFTSGMSNRLNYYLWCAPGQTLHFFKKTFNPELFKKFENQITDLQKIESFGWQIGIENGMIYNMARLKYNPEVYENPTSVIWKSHLGNGIINKPLFVINSSDKAHREIVVQDSDYNFLLISNVGRVLWKVKLQGPIRSEVYQLNCFKDGKFQYFFSTDEALHLINHEGNYEKHYPVALQSPATNGVSVVDYDKKGDFRFFVACKDHKVYLYDKKGNIVTGWTPAKTEHDVVRPVQFFRVENKDYIVFFDKNRGYILDRKGKTRVAIKGDIAYSNNSFTLEPGYGKIRPRLVTTDSKGTIVSIGFDGSVKRYSVGAFSPDHRFIFDTFDSDRKRDYIFWDGDSLMVYNQAATPIFKRKFNNGSILSPEIFTFPDKSRKIGVTDCFENRIYLFNSDGSVCKGFPIEGSSRFALGFYGNENGQVNLITGTSDGYFNNYLIK